MIWLSLLGLVALTGIASFYAIGVGMLLVALWSYSPPLLALLLAFIGITAWASYQVYYH